MPTSSNFITRQARKLMRRPQARPTAHLATTHLEDRVMPSISGIAFQDYNANGAFDTNGSIANTKGSNQNPSPAGAPGSVSTAIDTGFGGLIVRIFDSNGALVDTQTTAAGTGAWTSNAPTGTGNYRVEYSGFTTGYNPGPHGATAGTATQFLTNGGTANIGVVRAADYSPDNPLLVTQLYTYGSAVGSVSPAIISFPYSAGATGNVLGNVSSVDSDQPSFHDLAVPASQVGATWGLAQSKQQQSVYASAFTKRHSGWGPAGPGAIYRMLSPTQISGTTPSVTTASTWIDLQGATASYNGGTLAIDVIGATFSAWAAARQAPANQNEAFYENDGFNTGWDAVGRTSLGGLAISDDGNFVYVMNLAQKVLLEIPVNADGTANTAGIRAFDVPGVTGIPAADLQSFAVEYHNGLVYVGQVNTAESTQNRADLRGFVYQFNPATGTFGTTSVVNDGTVPVSNGAAIGATPNGFRLDYQRGNGYAGSENFLPWSTTFTTIATAFDGSGANAGSPRAVKYPQAMLTGFSFDNQDNIILNLRDRVGDQSGSSIPDGPPGDTLFYEAISAGDILKGFVLTANNNTWGLERNGASPPGAAFPGTGVTTSVTAFGSTFTGGPNDGEGPYLNPNAPTTGKAGANPGGEFFGSDFFAGSHQDTAIGSSAHVPGFPDIVTSNFDPVVAGNVRTSGNRWIRASDGTYVKAYQIYSQDQGGRGAYGSTFGKANGQGDLIAIAEPPPIEIGNRIFRDTNRNGIQDAGEPGIAGVIVDLLAADGTTLLASVTTNSNGEYYFNSGADPDTNSNPTNEKYALTALAAGKNYVIRVPNVAGATQQAALTGLITTKFNAIPDAYVGDINQQARNSDLQSVGTTGTISVNTGALGESIHTFDAGFAPGISLGNQVWNDVNNDGIFQVGTEVGVPNIPVALFTDANGDGTPDNGTPDFTTTTGPNGDYLFDGLAPGKYVVQITTPAGYRSSTGTPFDAVNGTYESVLISSKANSTINNVDHGYTVAGDILSGLTIRTNTVTLTDPGAGNPDPDLILGTANLRQDFGIYQAYSLGNRVWNDANNDGLLNNGEQGINGVTVRLFNLSAFDGNGNLNPGAIPLVTNAVTANGGYYRFDNLLEGQYVIVVTSNVGPLAGLVSSTGGTSATTTFEPPVNAVPAASKIDSQDGGTTGLGFLVRTGVITLGPGANAPIDELDLVTGVNPQGTVNNLADMTDDFGFYEPLSLGNQIWNDANNDGILNNGEAGINGVSVSVFRADVNGNPIGTALETQSTINGGYYLFTGLGTDSYVVQVNTTTLPAGFWLSSSGKNGSQSGPFNPGTNPNTDLRDSVDRGTVLSPTLVAATAIAISPNNAPPAGGTPGFTDTADLTDSYRIVDFGFYQPLSLGNLVWNDGNNNGLFDSGTEVGVDNIPVNLYADTDNNGIFNAAFDGLVGSTITVSGGFYLFQNLAPGGYFVEISAPGFVSSTGAPGLATGPVEPGITANIDSKDHGTNDPNGPPLIRSGLVTLSVGANAGSAAMPIADPTPVENRNYTLDFGIFQTLSVGNLVWNDVNNNGIYDQATELGIDGVLVELLDGGGNVIRTQNTAGNGAYLFQDLSSGNYTVRITAPTGFISSTGKVGGTANPYEPGIVGNQDGEDHGTQGTPFISAAQFFLAPAGDALNPDTNGSKTANLRQDFGLFVPLSLGDFIFGDVNNNGVLDGTETGLAGSTVTLTDSKNNPIGTQITAADGKYLFTNLVPDTYTVTVKPPANYVSSTGTNGKALGLYEPGITDNIDNADHGTRTGVGANAASTVTLTAAGNPDLNGTANLKQDFGFFQPLSLGDFVWIDADNDGIFNNAETGKDGVTVALLDGNGATVDTTVTGGGGNYGFTNLIPGNYTVRITTPAGYTSSTGTNGSISGPFEPGVTADTNSVDHGTKSKVTGFIDATVTLGLPGTNPNANGFANLNQDFGLFQPLRLGSFVWADVNKNGNLDAGEPPFAGVPVTLFDGNGKQVGTTINTDSKGGYFFENLTPGNYYVSIVPPAGVTPTPVVTPPLASQDQQNVGTVDPNNPAAIISPTVTLTLGGGPLVGQNANGDPNAYVTFDFGLQALAQLSGFTYVDGNLDGKFTPGANGDKAIPGVTVTLTGVDSNNQPLPTQFTTTDGTGFYQFINLLPGTYTVTETQPAGFYSAYDTPGPLGGSTPGINVLIPTTLVPNDNSPQNNFGEFLPRMEFGYVWVDSNANCTREIGELGLAGVPITIAGTAFAGTPFARPLVASDLPSGTLTTITDATGYYAFPVLPPGIYSIARGDLLPEQRARYADWCLQLGDPNPNPGTAGFNIFTGVPLTTPIIRGPYNFGVLPLDPNNPTKRNFLGSSTNNPNTPSGTLGMPGGPTTGPIQYNPTFATSTGNTLVSTDVVIGTGVGQRALVRVLDFGTGFERFRLEPYGNFTGSVRVAQGDVNGDGVPDIITGTGVGGGPRVSVFDGKTGERIKDFFAYEPEFRNGIFVTSGDVNGDGFADIITGTDAGGGPRVTVFDGVTGAKLQDFFAFDSSLRGGVRVAVGDFNGDNKADIVTTTGAGTATRVKIFNGQNPAAGALQDYFAFGSTFTLGATLGVGDINGDGISDVIVGTEAGGGPRVQVYNGNGSGVIRDFFAFDSNLRSGVRVAARDINGDGKAEIVVTAGNTGAARVRILNAADLFAFEDFFALHVDFRGGAYVG
ncbi:hypothetical protein BH11PLA2_BH11PLA2_42000 [soil metagenome]